MEKLIRDLALDQLFYDQWFDTATETQTSMLWKSVWETAAKTDPNNQFVVGCYNYFNEKGRLSYKQFYYLVRQTQPKTLSVTSLSQVFS